MSYDQYNHDKRNIEDHYRMTVWLMTVFWVVVVVATWFLAYNWGCS